MRNGAYQDLSIYSDVQSRVQSNGLIQMLAEIDETILGIPCNVQLSGSAKMTGDATLFKYCYKNIDLFTGAYEDPDGEELFEILKLMRDNIQNETETEFYDFEYYDANNSYLFMNKYSNRKTEAVELLCYVFDSLNSKTELSLTFPYPEYIENVEYKPSWRYYTYEYIVPITETFSQASGSDDKALRELARDAARQVRMRLEG